MQKGERKKRERERDRETEREKWIIINKIRKSGAKTS